MECMDWMDGPNGWRCWIRWMEWMSGSYGQIGWTDWMDGMDGWTEWMHWQKQLKAEDELPPSPNAQSQWPTHSIGGPARDLPQESAEVQLCPSRVMQKLPRRCMPRRSNRCDWDLQRLRAATEQHFRRLPAQTRLDHASPLKQ